MIDPSQVSAVLVTRGDEDLSEILDSISAAGITDTVIWDNSQRPDDLSCYGRYAGIAEARNPYILHQDDDLVAPIRELLAEYDPVADRDRIVANNRADEEWLLTAMGVIFHRSLAEGCFDRYLSLYGFDADFCRVSDVVFAYQHPYRRVVLGYRDLPWGFATAENPRMYGQPDHYAVRKRARERTLALAPKDSPLIVVPYVKGRRRRGTMEALKQYADGREVRYVELGRSDDAYWHLWCDLWEQGDDVIMIEQDIVIHADVLPSFDSCGLPWCAFAYPYSTFDWLYAGTGCVRFRRELIEATPNLWDEVGEISNELHPAKHWCSLDQFSRGPLETAGFTQHVHEPPVGHLDARVSHDCVRRAAMATKPTP